MNQNDKLWKQSKKIIHNGNMLVSKNPEFILPNKWPTYFSKAKDIFVWDLNKKKYTDFFFAVGTNTLGYSVKEIDKKVKENINNSNMSSLNCPDEVYLAKKLINIHPWANMVKFTRSGGEANAVAIRVARCSTSRHKVAICGYHGWHDWYISANINKNDKLSKHLLEGIGHLGVPNFLEKTVFPFSYGDLKTFRKLITDEGIGIVMMEFARTYEPNLNFLKEIRKLCKKNKIILIFDECTSGFRENYGGLHMKFNIYPDLAMFGKAIGNGYAINAVIGKKKYMKKAENSFISSTFWSERVGYTAALSSLKLMNKTKSWEKISLNGKKIKDGWLKLSKKYNLPIMISGLDSIPIFTFRKNHQIYKTFITQEMLKKSYLASNIVFVSVLHTKVHIDNYLKVLDSVFKKISMQIKTNSNPKKLIDDKISRENFKRLN